MTNAILNILQQAYTAGLKSLEIAKYYMRYIEGNEKDLLYVQSVFSWF